MSLPDPATLAPIEAHALLAGVARAFNLTVADLVGPRQHFHLARARFAACWLLVHRPAPGGRMRSRTRVGQLLGGRDHSTVCHALARCKRLARDNPDWLRALTALARDLPAAMVPYQPAPDRTAERAKLAAVIGESRTRFGEKVIEDDAGAVDRAKGSLALAEAIARMRQAAA